MTTHSVRVAVVGAGAFGVQHLPGLTRMEGATVTTVVDPDLERARALADQHGVTETATDLATVLDREDIDALLLCTPSPLHAEQALAGLRAGKHVQVEIPLALSLADAEAVARAAQESGLVAMVGHTRRYNPGHRHLQAMIRTGHFALHHLEVATHFMRRTNVNALGQSRNWTDHLLWHHAAHTVDLFAHQSGTIVRAHAMQGPMDPTLGIALDMSIQLKSETGTLCTLSLSFNDDGPIGTTFRYIGDRGTYLARYDSLATADGTAVDLSALQGSPNGIEEQDIEFIRAIRTRDEAATSVNRVLDCYRVLQDLETQLG